MTLAIAEGLMNGGNAEDFTLTMKKFGHLYPNAGYGGRFGSWLFSEDIHPYNSWGNGSAMRVSPVAWMFDTLSEVEKYAEISAAVTHNHPEGIKGAKATAAAIFLARKGKTKDEIKAYVESEYGYDLSRPLDEIRPNYRFNESCQATVPEAIIAFLESIDFEDAIRNAISLGGDSDTLAAITGSIAEAAYDIPEDIKGKVLSILDECLLNVYRQFFEKIKGSKDLS
jgi:ADP-ribosylglycohydrolase